ncbi:unnamed protein product (macronuclear) [Paramecium tetraurelia]|uniref:Serine carboxypeptidase S28 family protein n=1 Tax=Paramecium tetraurelia TaxID=5888 RepID=A0D9I7_PARTE|nr:uncharacterized protein GSPATT00014634001 [Paramecium tetraurelia]CAK79704.1 unnamed protein product [Paramecium tetraurelia]|eukprot:XP_001447101.1 hypothetical protein (macronuclear) [Paramecium tetraurelia strain d4-2]
MKIVILLVLVMSSLARLTYKNSVFGREEIIQANNTLWFTQKLDHNDPTSKEVFRQRYHVYDDYVVRNQPESVILYICGEWTCDGIGSGLTFDAAQQLKALVLVLEHRYFGQSQPFGDWSTPNLKYLNIHQALDDIAYFIQDVKAKGLFNIKPNTPWIHLGGSYPGALSAWFRYKYPHLTIGGLASSAVVKAVACYHDYDMQVYLSALESSQECVDRIQQVNEKIEADLIKSPNTIKAEFKASELTDIEFLSMIADIYAGMVQGRKRSKMCERLEGGATLDDWFKQVKEMALETVDQESYGSEFLKDISIDFSKNSRQWTYQTCIEVGYFQTANPNVEQSTRSQQLKLDFFRNLCEYSYGISIFPDEERTNAYFGGLDINVDHLIFSNGSDDPWQHASITKWKQGKEYDVKYIKCKDCSHCIDLKATKADDPPELTQARKEILAIFQQWINEYNDQQSQIIE